MRWGEGPAQNFCPLFTNCLYWVNLGMGWGNLNKIQKNSYFFRATVPKVPCYLHNKDIGKGEKGMHLLKSDNQHCCRQGETCWGGWIEAGDQFAIKVVDDKIEGGVVDSFTKTVPVQLMNTILGANHFKPRSTQLVCHSSTARLSNSPPLPLPPIPTMADLLKSHSYFFESSV